MPYRQAISEKTFPEVPDVIPKEDREWEFVLFVQYPSAKSVSNSTRIVNAHNTSTQKNHESGGAFHWTMKNLPSEIFCLLEIHVKVIQEDYRLIQCCRTLRSFFTDGLMTFISGVIVWLFVHYWRRYWRSSRRTTCMLLCSSRSDGNIDAHSSRRTQRTETNSIQIEMETNAQCSILVWFATRAQQRIELCHLTAFHPFFEGWLVHCSHRVISFRCRSLHGHQNWIERLSLWHRILKIFAFVIFT